MMHLKKYKYSTYYYIIIIHVVCKSGSILKLCYVLVLCGSVNVAAENISFCVQHITDGAEFPPFHLGYGSHELAMDGVGGTLLSEYDGIKEIQLSIDDVAYKIVRSSANCFKVGVVGGCLWNKCDHQH